MLEIVAESKHLKKTYLDNNGMLLHSVDDTFLIQSILPREFYNWARKYCVLVYNINLGIFRQMVINLLT